MSHIPHLINGERVAGNGRSAPVYNPSTGDSTSAVGLALTRLKREMAKA